MKSAVANSEANAGTAGQPTAADAGELVVRTKYLRGRIRHLARTRDWGRMRPLTCFRILGLDGAAISPITAQSFDLARSRWIAVVTHCRETGDGEHERAANLAWQHLKNWRCPVCGGLKPRIRNASCGQVCGDKLRRATRLKKLGPVILRMQARSAALTGNRYGGHALRRAQLTTLRNALEKCGHCVADTARELGMSYGTVKYYIRKFGGYINGQRTPFLARV